MAAIRSAKPHAQKNSEKQNRGRCPSSPCFARSRRYALHDPVQYRVQTALHDYCIFSVADSRINRSAPISFALYLYARFKRPRYLSCYSAHATAHLCYTADRKRRRPEKRLYASPGHKNVVFTLQKYVSPDMEHLETEIMRLSQIKKS